MSALSSFLLLAAQLQILRNGTINPFPSFVREYSTATDLERVSSGILVPQNTARGTTFTITFTGKSGAIDEAATATVTAK